MSPTELSLYVHLPWCVRKCPYCDFNSHPAVGGMDEAAYVEALIRDLDFDVLAGESFIEDRPLQSIFFGGGTPSLFSASAIAQILEAVDSRLHLAAEVEITLEANPGAAEQQRFRDYRTAGVNRLSIGIQSFDDARLNSLGRIHGRREALQAAEAAAAAGIENFNLDLMYALPGQSLEAAAGDLRQAIELGPRHISYYQLTLEPGTHFHRHPPPLPDHDLAWDMQLQGEALLSQAGYGQYEVSAYARSGQACRHNLNYWQFGDYLGIGAGAHGKLTNTAARRIVRTAKQRLPIQYMAHAGAPAAIVETREVAPHERGFEYLLNALRLRDGFALQALCKRTAMAESQALALLQPAVDNGLLKIRHGRVVTTDAGWRHIDSILTAVLDDASTLAEKCDLETCLTDSESIELRALR